MVPVILQIIVLFFLFFVGLVGPIWLFRKFIKRMYGDDETMMSGFDRYNEGFGKYNWERWNKNPDDNKS